MTLPRSFPTAREVFSDTVADLLDTPPQMLSDLRFAEQEARRVAQDQVLVELFANARDAAVGYRGEGAPRVRVEVDGDALLVANDGTPWSWDGYVGVRRIGGSPKREIPRPAARGQKAVVLSLGRHGIGFRSVLAVTGRPEIHGVDAESVRFALGFGAPRLEALAVCACAGDEGGCLAALSEDEAAWLRDVIAAPRDLPQRSLVLHTRRWELEPTTFSAGLPTLPFPLWIPEADVAGRVDALLTGGDGERPFSTVIRLPLPPGDDNALAGLLAQLPMAQRCFMGTSIRTQTAL